MSDSAEPQNQAVIVALHGCDDSTRMTVSVNRAQLVWLKELAERSKDMSEYGCMPILEVKE